MGHLQAVCRSKPQKPHQINAVSHQSRDEYTLFQLTDSDMHSQAPLEVTVSADGHDLTMEVDTGASCSLISKRTFDRYWQDHDLHQSTVNLRTYSGERLGVLGKFSVDVSYRDQQATLPLLVVDGSGPSLLGRDWLAHLRLDWKSIHHIRHGPLRELLNRHKTLLQDGLGTFKGYEAKLHIDPQAVPKYCKARPVPYAMRAKVEEELK